MTEKPETPLWVRFLNACALYGQKNIIASFALGMSSGFPLAFVVSLTGIWLSRYGIQRSTVGLFVIATSFYSWKFLWAPIVDRFGLFGLAALWGQRRSWLFLLQALLVVAFLGLGRLDPQHDLGLVAVLVALVAFLSASQDIVVDAYRIEIAPKNDLGHSASAYIFGYRFAATMAGITSLLLAQYFGWGLAISLLPLFALPAFFAALWIGEPLGSKRPDVEKTKENPSNKGGKAGALARIREAFWHPLQDFMQRPFWLWILLFVFLFKAGDAVTAVMTGPLIVDMGYSESAIAYANKVVGLIAVLIGTALGAVLYRLLGAYAALFLAGIMMMVTNLGFAWLALGDAELWRLALVIALENFATGVGATIIIAYFSGLCSVGYTATQFALLSSLSGQARAILGAPSGYVAESLGWVDFFIASSLLALPGLLLLCYLWRRLDPVLSIHKRP